MSSYIEVVVLVEGPTEQRFVKDLLAPYLSKQNIYMTPIILDKPGQKGGDVKFARAKNDIEKHLKQRRDTWITIFVDYYGIRGDWPGYEQSKKEFDHRKKAAIVNQATAEEVQKLFPNQNPAMRFIPYVSMHEIEALYFSDPAVLAAKLGVKQKDVDDILREFGEPEQINDNPQTAPSKRLEKLSDRFKKTTTGIVIAEAIGLEKIRQKCSVFNRWLTKIEDLRGLCNA